MRRAAGTGVPAPGPGSAVRAAPTRGAPGVRRGPPPRPGPPARRLAWGLLLAAAVVWSLTEAGVWGGELVNPGGWVQVHRFALAAFRPRLDAAFLRLVGDAALTTLAFAVCGTALSLAIGCVGGLLGSEAWWRSVVAAGTGRFRWPGGWRAPWVAVRGALALPRAIHEIVWGLLFLTVLGLDPLVGILAIAIPFGAITAKVFSEVLDETDARARWALEAAGATPPAAILYGLVPRALPDLLSYAFYRFECSIRSAAVLGIIGAGGLGYQIFLSLQSLRYGEMWTLLFALIVLTGLADLWSSLLRRRLGSSHRVHVRLRPAPDGEREVPTEAEFGTLTPRAGAGAPAGGGEETRGPAGADRRARREGSRRDPVVRVSLLLGGALLLFSFWYVDAGWGKAVAARSWRLLSETLGEALPPSLGGLAPGDYLALSARTVAMSLLAMAVAGVGGVLLSFPGAHNFLLPGGILDPDGRSGWRSAAGTATFALTRGLLLLLRAVPAPVWALILLFGFFPGILPGALALGIYTLGVLGRLMAEVTENLDGRPLLALRAQGATGPGVFLYGVLPSAAPRYASYLLYRWEVAVRATAMVGVVGAGGLGRLLQEQLSSFDYAAVATTTLFYVGLTLVVDLLSAFVRRELR